jgi:hypothetical protein
VNPFQDRYGALQVTNVIVRGSPDIRLRCRTAMVASTLNYVSGSPAGTA